MTQALKQRLTFEIHSRCCNQPSKKCKVGKKVNDFTQHYPTVKWHMIWVFFRISKGPSVTVSNKKKRTTAVVGLYIVYPGHGKYTLPVYEGKSYGKVFSPKVPLYNEWFNLRPNWTDGEDKARVASPYARFLDRLLLFSFICRHVTDSIEVFVIFRYWKLNAVRPKLVFRFLYGVFLFQKKKKQTNCKKCITLA